VGGDLCDIARAAAVKSDTNNTAVAAARDRYTGEIRTAESGAVPANVNPNLEPRLEHARWMKAQGNHLAPWDPGTCAEFHGCNNLMNDVGARFEDLEYGTVNKKDLSPFLSCGWCRLILIDGGATERTL